MDYFWPKEPIKILETGTITEGGVEVPWRRIEGIGLQVFREGVWVHPELCP